MERIMYLPSLGRELCPRPDPGLRRKSENPPAAWGDPERQYRCGINLRFRRAPKKRPLELKFFALIELSEFELSTKKFLTHSSAIVKPIS